MRTHIPKSDANCWVPQTDGCCGSDLEKARTDQCMYSTGSGVNIKLEDKNAMLIYAGTVFKKFAVLTNPYLCEHMYLLGENVLSLNIFTA